VEVSGLKMEVALTELEPVEGAASGEDGGGGSVPSGASGDRGGWTGPRVEASSEVDLRGLRVAEVELELSRALDRAVLADLSQLRIVHGKGTGALRARVAELLDRDRRVESFRGGRPGEGGSGVTVVSLS
jgi:DNA mismatch repair protein MutS2